MTPGRRTPQFRYGVAVVMTGIMLLISLLIYPVTSKAPSLLFLLGVIISAWLGGLGPSLAATILSVATLNYFFFEPAYSFATTSTELLELVVFAVVSILTSKLVDDRRKAQQELRRANLELTQTNRELERRVEERTRDLSRANEQLTIDLAERERIQRELARSNHDLEQFAYTVSHDLQTPLRMISSYIDLVTQRYQRQLDSEVQEFLGYVHSGARRMHQLITDLLAYSRVLGNRRDRFEWVDCTAAIQWTLMALNPAMKETAATVTYGELPKVFGDQSQLIQLFQNLIGNSLKYHSQEPPVIHVSAARDGDVWTFTVEDNGIGIEPEYHDQIFAVFKRLHGEEEYSGTGIGLAVCQKIVEHHGGRIWVESESGRGARFRFTLPAGEPGGAPLSS